MHAPLEQPSLHVALFMHSNMHDAMTPVVSLQARLQLAPSQEQSSLPRHGVSGAPPAPFGFPPDAAVVAPPLASTPPVADAARPPSAAEPPEPPEPAEEIPPVGEPAVPAAPPYPDACSPFPEHAASDAIAMSVLQTQTYVPFTTAVCSLGGEDRGSRSSAKSPAELRAQLGVHQRWGGEIRRVESKPISK